MTRVSTRFLYSQNIWRESIRGEFLRSSRIAVLESTVFGFPQVSLHFNEILIRICKGERYLACFAFTLAVVASHLVLLILDLNGIANDAWCCQLCIKRSTKRTRSGRRSSGPGKV